MPWILFKWVCLSELIFPLIYLCMLVFYIVSAYYFQIPLWTSFSPMEAQPFGFTPPQPFGEYLLYASVHSGDGPRPTLGMHWVAAPYPGLSRGVLMLLLSCPSATLAWWSGNQPLGLGREWPDASTSPTWWGGIFFSRLGSTTWHDSILTETLELDTSLRSLLVLLQHSNHSTYTQLVPFLMLLNCSLLLPSNVIS